MSKNKVSQAARREIRQYVGRQYEIISEIIRARPRWVPLKVWGWIASIVIDTRKLEMYLKEGITKKDKR